MKVYLAGMDSRHQYFDVMRPFPPFALHAFKKGARVPVIEKLKENGVESIMIDSGAFSFLAGKRFNKEKLAEYVDKYIDYLKQNKIDLFFELDLDPIIGYEEVVRIRKEIETRMGKQCIPVWHRSRGKNDFLNMLDEYKYVAVGGLVTGEWKKEEKEVVLAWAARQAFKKRVRIHMLGLQRQEFWYKFQPLGLYSVDFSGWLNERWGFINMVKDGILRRHRFEGRRLKVGKTTEDPQMELVVKRNTEAIVKLVNYWKKRGIDEAYYS